MTREIVSAKRIEVMIAEAAAHSDITGRAKSIALIWTLINMMPEGRERNRISNLCRSAAMKDFARSA